MSGEENSMEYIVKDEPTPVLDADKDTIVKIVDDSDDDKGNSVEKKLKKLQKKLEKEKQARKEAEQRARKASESLQTAYSEVEDTNLQLVNSAIDTKVRDNETLTAQYAEAMSIGDYTTAAKLQRAISTNEAELLQLKNGKDAMESRPKVQAPSFTDPVEDFASQLSPRSADWVRKHPQCVTDPRLKESMIAAHTLALNQGHRADTDDYFDFIEDTLRLSKKEKKKQEERYEEESPLSSASKPSSRNAPPAAAPVNREGNGRSNIVRLTSAEIDAANSMGMKPEEYARNKMMLRREGRMN